MNAEQQALVQRWDGFLAKIKERLDEIIAEATAGCAQIAAQHPLDSLPLNNALTGLDHRIRQLRERIEETWDGQVEEKFSDAGDGGFLDVGLDKKEDFETAFDHHWSNAKAKILCDYAASLYPLAQEASQQQPKCDQCGAPLTPSIIYKSEMIACPACSAQNLYEPPLAIVAYRGTAAHYLADAAMLPKRQAIDWFRIEVDRWRRAREWAPEPLESLEKWRAMELDAWTTYANEKARVLGEPVDQGYIDGRMAHFDKYELHMNQVWVNAHGKG
ncbi:MAG: hypothetical protein JJ863_33980 [Deltaproteobacteria bacterium]|nr:hypothetical protein [Deltaproteobacteria bacterium]